MKSLLDILHGSRFSSLLREIEELVVDHQIFLKIGDYIGGLPNCRFYHNFEFYNLQSHPKIF